MADRALPLLLFPKLLPVLAGAYVHAQARLTVPRCPGLYRALIDIVSRHSWIKPYIEDQIEMKKRSSGLCT